MSKLLDNGSMTLRVSVVGQTLTRSSAQRAKVNVLEFLSSNPELYEKLWELMDTDLIGGCWLRTLRRSCQAAVSGFP